MTYRTANIGPNIARRQAALRLTQQEVAETLGVSVMTIHRWKRGDRTPSVDHLIGLARLLEATVDEMLS